MTAQLLPEILPEFSNVDNYFLAYKITNEVVDKLLAKTTIIAAEDDEVVPATTFQHLNENGQLKFCLPDMVVTMVLLKIISLKIFRKKCFSRDKHIRTAFSFHHQVCSNPCVDLSQKTTLLVKVLR